MTSASKSTDIAIVGGGVIGLCCAWRLAQQGLAVDVLERNVCNSGASHAAAGMLAPQIEAEPGEEPLLPLLITAQSHWPEFAAQLQEASGLSIDYRTEGTLMVAEHTDALATVRRHFEYMRNRLNLAVSWLEPSDIRELEPYISERIAGGFLSEADHQVDNRKLGRALLVACRKAGVTIREHTLATGLLIQEKRCAGVRTGTDTLFAEHVLLCGGAWSKLLPDIPQAIRSVQRPIKGQMLAFRQNPAEPLIRHVVWGDGIYLVPKSDGRVLAGATVEEQGFDERVTGQGILYLLERAERILPGLLELELQETWAGLRPGSLDDAPLIGASPMDKLWLASAHYRNGILLAPLTAHIISRLLAGAPPEPLWQRGMPNRFF